MERQWSDEELFWVEFLNRYDAGEEFDSHELADIVYDCDEVEENPGECGRWTQGMETIFQVGDRFFSIYWERGLTEYQDDEFFSQPEEVVLHEYEKLVKVREWITKKTIDSSAFKEHS